MRHVRPATPRVPAPCRRHGRAFTLVELLVVIGIILLLMAVGTLVLGNVLHAARVRATEATIAKVNGMMQERLEAFQRAMENKSGKTSYNSYSAMLRGVERGDLQAAIQLLQDRPFRAAVFAPEINPHMLDQASERTWEVLGRKLCFRMKFPMTFAEVAGLANGAPGGPGTDDNNNSVVDFLSSTFPFYGNRLPDPQEFGQYPANTSDLDKDDLLPFATLLRERLTSPQNHQPETESAEMLYLILTAGDVLGVPPVGSDEFSSSEVRDTDGDGLLEFVDGWGRPLRFYRWPTRLLMCGDDGPPGRDTNGDSQRTPPGPRPPANPQQLPGGVPDPTYARLLIGTLPSAQAGDAALRRDPDDGLNLLYTQLIKRNDTNTPVNGNGDLNARLKLERLFHTPETYHTLLIVSAGPDGQLGMYEPVQFHFDNHDPDNTIYGHLGQLARDATLLPTHPVNQLGDPATHPINDNITNRRR